MFKNRLKQTLVWEILSNSSNIMFNLIFLLTPLVGLVYSTSVKYESRKFNKQFSSYAIRPQDNYSLNSHEDIAQRETLETETSVSANVNKNLALQTSVFVLLMFLFVFVICDFSSNQFQFVQEYYEANAFNFYLGIDGLSIYFLLLTTIIMPISLLSNWTSISYNVNSYLIIILLLEILLLLVFLALDVLLFYIFFESILPPLFILIGLFGSDNRVRASFYLFLYTLLGSLFLLLSILTMFSTMGATHLDILYKMNFSYYLQILLFCGIFIAFAVKTPTIFLNIDY